MMMPENEAIHEITCHPIQSMTNAVKNSSSRSTTSLPVFGALRRFLYKQLIENYGTEGTFERDQMVLQQKIQSFRDFRRH
jgi:hypothetical protein